MNSGLAKRLAYEIKIYESQKKVLNNAGIFLDYNTDNLTSMKCLIIGPDNTPYEGGFYIFKIDLPDNYPFNPPKFTFLTRFDNIRFHPNFYVNGYVCLSILNTWGNNEWSPCQTLTAILSTIQSIMNSNPIINEPHYENENENGLVAQNYNKIVQFYNIRGAVLGYINLSTYQTNTTNNTNNTNNSDSSYYSNFTGIIKEKIKENYEKYYKNIMKNMIYDGQQIICNTYSMNVLLDYTKLKNDFIKLF